MKTWLFVMSVLLLPVLTVAAADPKECPMHSQHQAPATVSPYAGQQNAEIKSLSSEDIRKYLAGEGMGQARAAELNHYPGPRHILDLSQQLSLRPEQEKEARAIFEQMHDQAVALGTTLVEKERELDREFSAATITESRMKELLDDIGALQSRLRYTHLSAHLRIKPILSAEQVSKYDELRGYGEEAQPEHHH